MYISNLPQDELITLRDSAHIVRAEIMKIERMLEESRFCPKLVGYAKDFIALADALDDTCIESLLTDEEAGAIEHEIAVEQANVIAERRAYYANQL